MPHQQRLRQQCSTALSRSLAQLCSLGRNLRPALLAAFASQAAHGKTVMRLRVAHRRHCCQQTAAVAGPSCDQPWAAEHRHSACLQEPDCGSCGQTSVRRELSCEHGETSVGCHEIGDVSRIPIDRSVLHLQNSPASRRQETAAAPAMFIGMRPASTEQSMPTFYSPLCVIAMTSFISTPEAGLLFAALRCAL